MDSAESLQPLKLMEYPPNAFLPFAMTPPYLVVVSPLGSFLGGIPTTRTRGRKEKTLSLGPRFRGSNTPEGYRPRRRAWFSATGTRASRRARTSGAAP